MSRPAPIHGRAPAQELPDERDALAELAGRQTRRAEIVRAAVADADGTSPGPTWAFGPGAAATGAVAPHAFAAPGSYAVTVTVRDDAGATATATVAVAARAKVVWTRPVRPSISSPNASA